MSSEYEGNISVLLQFQTCGTSPATTVADAELTSVAVVSVVVVPVHRLILCPHQLPQGAGESTSLSVRHSHPHGVKVQLLTLLADYPRNIRSGYSFIGPGMEMSFLGGDNFIVQYLPNSLIKRWNYRWS